MATEKLTAGERSVLTAMTLKGQVDTLRNEVARADGNAALAVEVAEKKRTAFLKEAQETREAAQKEADDVLAEEIGIAGAVPIEARKSLEEAEKALREHLALMEKEHGLVFSFMNPEPVKGGRINL